MYARGCFQENCPGHLGSVAAPTVNYNELLLCSSYCELLLFSFFLVVPSVMSRIATLTGVMRCFLFITSVVNKYSGLLLKWQFDRGMGDKKHQTYQTMDSSYTRRKRFATGSVLKTPGEKMSCLSTIFFYFLVTSQTRTYESNFPINPVSPSASSFFTLFSPTLVLRGSEWKFLWVCQQCVALIALLCVSVLQFCSVFLFHSSPNADKNS